MEYTQSKYRKRLNQQQSHDYQAGIPMTAMGGMNAVTKGQRPNVSNTVGNQSRASKKLVATQLAIASESQPSNKLVSTHIAQS